MQHDKFAKIQVTNNFPGNATVTIHHIYSTSPDEVHTFATLAANATSGADLQVSYMTGIMHPGHDYWTAEVTVLDGACAGTWKSFQGQATLKDSDNNATLTFMVSQAGFNIQCHENNANPGWSTHP